MENSIVTCGACHGERALGLLRYRPVFDGFGHLATAHNCLLFAESSCIEVGKITPLAQIKPLIGACAIATDCSLRH